MKQIKFIQKALCILILFYSSYIFGQNNSFIKIISTENSEYVSASVEIPDEGYIISTTENIENKVIQKFIKINFSGDTLISHSIASIYSKSWIPQLILMKDGTVMGIGEQSDILNNNNKLWVLKFDTELNIITDKKYDVPYNIYKIGTCVDHFNNVIVNGYYYDTDNINMEDVFVFRLSEDGDSVNYKRLQYPEPQYSQSIMEKLDHTGYYMPIWGRMNSLNLYLANMVELDYNFNITFEDSITNNVGFHNNIKKFNDYQYILSGQTWFPSASFDNEFIAVEKLDANYHSANYRRIGPYLVDTVTYPAWIQNLDFIDTTSMFCGGTVNLQAYPNQGNHSYLILANLDNALNVKWQFFYGLDKYYEMHGLLSTTDGGCLLLATFFNFTQLGSDRDILLIKVDSNGLITSMNSEPEFKISNAILYPNPGTEYINIQSGPQITGAEFYMFDMQGKPVLNEKINNTQLKVNTTNLSPGTYPWQIVFKNNVIESGKWIKK
jgi:hypothetical protein